MPLKRLAGLELKEDVLADAFDSLDAGVPAVEKLLSREVAEVLVGALREVRVLQATSDRGLSELSGEFLDFW